MGRGEEVIDVSLGEFLTSKFALWLDLRTTDDDQLHVHLGDAAEVRHPETGPPAAGQVLSAVEGLVGDGGKANAACPTVVWNPGAKVSSLDVPDPQRGGGGGRPMPPALQYFGIQVPRSAVWMFQTLKWGGGVGKAWMFQTLGGVGRGGGGGRVGGHRMEVGVAEADGVAVPAVEELEVEAGVAPAEEVAPEP